MTIRQGDKIVAGYTPSKDYLALENRPSINHVELNGNLSLSDLGIQPKGSYVETDNFAEFVTTTINDFEELHKNIDTRLSEINAKIKFTHDTVVNKLKYTNLDYNTLSNKPTINGKVLEKNIVLTESDLIKDTNYVTVNEVKKLISENTCNEDVYSKEEIDKLIKTLKQAEYITKTDLSKALRKYVSNADLSLKVADELSSFESNVAEPYIIEREKSKEELKREERNQNLENILWRITRFEQQTKLGIKTEDSENIYFKLLQYAQYLRDIPQNKQFPDIEILKFEEYLTTL